MESAKKHHYLRDRRDRLVDILGFAETHPLRDLPVDVERLMVPAGSTAKIPVEASQRDCDYALYERSSETLATSPTIAGHGETILMDSPPIPANGIAYRIRSTRNTTGKWVYLHEICEIKTGIETAARPRVLSGSWLIATAEDHPASDPRVVDWQTEVEVEIQNTQYGVLYRLVHDVGGTWVTLSQADVAGNFGTIKLRTTALTDDTVIRIQVINSVDTSNTKLLDVALPVYVYPRTDLPVYVQTSHIIECNTKINVCIGDTQDHPTQPSIGYKLFVRPLDISDFLDQEAPDGTSVNVNGESQDVFIVRRPAHASAWVVPDGFIGNGGNVGNGGVLKPMSTTTFQDDSLILIRSKKTITRPNGEQVTIEAPQRQVAVVLVRPNATPALKLQVFVADATTNGAVRITGGQRGVFYHLRDAVGGADIGRTGYFYERYGTNPEKNVGIGLLRIGRDLAVAHDLSTDPVVSKLREIEAASQSEKQFVAKSPLEYATTLPELPIVDTPPLAAGSSLFGFAVKRRNHLTKALAHSATIFAVPVMTVQLTEPDGPVASIGVTSSVVGDTYSLLVNGVPAGEAQQGNGQDLTFVLAESIEGDILDVSIQRGAAPAIVLEQFVRAYSSPAPEASV